MSSTATTNKNTVYLITGANRGIGLGLTLSLLTRPSTTVIATVRDPSSRLPLEEAISSASFAIGTNSNLLIAHLDFSPPSPPTPEQILSAILSSTPPSGEKTETIDHIDIFISNAGWPSPLVPILSTTQSDLRSSFEINAIAPLSIFQAIYEPLLQRKGKVIMITSSVGIISQQEGPGGGYGPSKAALNWITKAIHTQHEDIVALAVHPGWVRTRAGWGAARDWGFGGEEEEEGEGKIGPKETVEGCVRGILGIVDGARREEVGGRFLTDRGEELPW